MAELYLPFCSAFASHRIRLQLHHLERKYHCNIISSHTGAHTLNIIVAILCHTCLLSDKIMTEKEYIYSLSMTRWKKQWHFKFYHPITNIICRFYAYHLKEIPQRLDSIRFYSLPLLEKLPGPRKSKAVFFSWCTLKWEITEI